MTCRLPPVSRGALCWATALVAAAAFLTPLLWPGGNFSPEGTSFPLQEHTQPGSPGAPVTGSGEGPGAADREIDETGDGEELHNLAAGLRALPSKPAYLKLLEFQLRLSQLDREELDTIFEDFPSCTAHLDEGSRAALTSAFFARLAEFDPAGAFRRAIQLSIEPAPEPVDDPFSALPLKTIPDAVDKIFLSAACEGALLVWGQQDCQAAVAAACRAVDEGFLGDPSVYRLLARVSISRPAELIDYIVAAHPGEYMVRENTILKSWARQDPQAALNWVQINFTVAAQPLRLRVLLSNLPNTIDPRKLPELVAGALNIQDVRQRQQAVAMLMRDLGGQNAEAALQLLEAIPATVRSESFVSENLHWMMRAPGAAAPFIEQLPSTPERTDFIRRNAAAMAATDAAQAHHWINSVPGLTDEERQSVVQEIFPHDASENPEA